MARTIDMTQVRSRGKPGRQYQSLLKDVQGEVSVGDTLLLRDGAFLVTRVGPTFKRRGHVETEVRIEPASEAAN